MRVPKYKTKYETCDKFIREEINKRSNGTIRDKLLELWIKDISKEEEKSMKMLETKTSG